MSTPKRRSANRWTPYREKHLLSNYPVLPAELLREFYGVSHSALRKKAERIGARKRKWQAWTEEELALLRKFGWPITRQVARLFNRSPGAVRDKLRNITYVKQSSSAKEAQK
jgi:hypothetical protein